MGGRGSAGILPYLLTVCVAVAAVAMGMSAAGVIALAAATLLATRRGVPWGRRALWHFIEARTARQALRASEERLRFALDAGHMGAYDWNIATGEVVWSEQLEHLHGLPPGTFGRTFDAALATVHPEDRSDFRLAAAHALELGMANRVEYRTVWPDGSVHWLVSTGDVLRDATGRITRLTGVVMEVTGRKRLEAARADLLARETAARAVAEEAGLRTAFLAEATAIVSSSFDCARTLDRLARLAVPFIADACIVHVAEADGTLCCLALAHTDADTEAVARELVRRHPPRREDPSGPGHAVHSGQPELVVEVTEKMLRDGARDADYVAILQSLGVVSAMCAPLQARGETLGAITFLSTTAGRHFGRADQTLAEETGRRAALAIDNARLYRAAEAANRVKDEFLATLSHELRTPLSAILGWTRLLRARKLDEAGIARALATIELNTKLQVQLVEDLLDISRLITGKLRLDRRPVDLVTVVEAAVDSVRTLAEAKGIQLDTQLVAPGPLSGDASRLEQVVWNLLSNAVKFTPRNGRIALSLDRAGTDAVIRISDTGRGIAPEFLGRIFESFWQADASSTRTQGGLGLGLAIVRRVVELHGGSVQADSGGAGRGATFTVRLPLSALDAGVAAPEGVADRLPSLDRVSVLVVDDARDAREALAMLLEECGAHVTAVASAPAALDAMAQARPDVIISDLAMPGVDGYELLARVRAREAGAARPVPALALSAYARREDRERALAAGFQAHIAKPVEPGEIAAAVARLATGADFAATGS